MSVWRYVAVPAGSDRVRRGVIAAASVDDARDALRHAGMRPVRIRPGSGGAGRVLGAPWMYRAVCGYLRKRRSGVKAEAFDALATLMRSGVTPLSSLRVLAGSDAARVRAGRLGRLVSRWGGGGRMGSGFETLCRSMMERVAGGVALSEAARDCPGWFDGAECAVLAAGERAGELDAALARLAERRARSHDLGSRLVGVMVYPAVVSVVGCGVAVFLSVRTLPELAAVLGDAGVGVPALTRGVMVAGQFVAGWFPLVLGCGVMMSVGLLALFGSGRLRMPGWLGGWLGGWLVRRSPVVLRRVRVAESFLALGELTESGLTPVESVRVIAPMSVGPLGGALGRAWERAADRIEQGERFCDVLDDDVWFTGEHRALLLAGGESGGMSATLRRLGERDRRSAHRLIDRASALLEPVSIVLLTVFVGLIVLSAILPIVRLGEVIG